MHKLRAKGIAVFAVVGVFAFSGLAMAAPEDGDDTVFNFGGVEEEQFLIWNVSSIDFEATDPLSFEDLETACSLEGETLQYSVDGEGAIVREGGAELGEDCGDFVGGQVTGPNGQINPGMYLKLFNSLHDGPGRGCLVRHLAQSTLGTDNQVTVGDADAEFEPIGEGEVTFTTAAADCIHGNQADGDDDGPGNSAAALAKFGEGGPGKSGDAPGRNK